MRFLLAAAIAFTVVMAGTAAPAAAPDQTKPDQVKPDQAKYFKPDQVKPDQVKLARPDQIKPDQVKPDQVYTGKHKIVHVRHARLKHKLARLHHLKHHAKLRYYA